MRRAEEILEIAEILDQAADGLAKVLERSGADELHPAETLREMARYELEHAAVAVAMQSSTLRDSRLLFRNRAKGVTPAPWPWGEDPETEPPPTLSADALRVRRQILM
jgi:hypothetical protein